MPRPHLLLNSAYARNRHEANPMTLCHLPKLWIMKNHIFPPSAVFGDNGATQTDWPSMRRLFCECSNYHFRRIDSVCVPLTSCVTESRFCLHRVVAVLLCVCEKNGLCVYDCRKRNVTVFYFCSHIVSHDTCRAKRFCRFLSLELSFDDGKMHTNWTREKRKKKHKPRLTTTRNKLKNKIRNEKLFAESPQCSYGACAKQFRQFRRLSTSQKTLLVCLNLECFVEPKASFRIQKIQQKRERTGINGNQRANGIKFGI